MKVYETWLTVTFRVLMEGESEKEVRDAIRQSHADKIRGCVEFSTDAYEKTPKPGEEVLRS